MADAKAKTINLLLYEGDLEGVISIEDSSWNSGELYSAPRDSVSELLETDACKKYGVYLLLSKAWSMLVSPLICQKESRSTQSARTGGKALLYLRSCSVLPENCSCHQYPRTLTSRPVQ